MSDTTPPRRLLLGTVAWDRPDWRAAYYPQDLPDAWRLAYYANDCDCLMLAAGDWCALDDESLAEAGAVLRYLLLAPRQWTDSHSACLARFDPARSVLLGAVPAALVGDREVWPERAPDRWCSDAGEGVERWALDEFDLRALRARAATLDHRTRALCIDGPAASPGRIAELRTLLELLGRA